MIFVSPVPLSDETLQYYTKLLGLSAAVASGEVEDQCDMSDRYKVLVPEAIKSFPVRTLTWEWASECQGYWEDVEDYSEQFGRQNGETRVTGVENNQLW